MASRHPDDQMTETSHLLGETGSATSGETSVFTARSSKLLIVAFLAALAIATTAATEIYAYAVISCQDPGRCREDEGSKYEGTVAIAVTIANIVSLLLLDWFVCLCRHNRRLALFSWLLFRSMSVIVLAIGVSARSILVTLSGRVFEGVASDNILHFILNAIYVQEQEKEHVPRLIGFSLTAYMAGICIGPLLPSLLRNFQTSFTLAVLIFAAAAVALAIIRTEGASDEPQPLLPDEEARQKRSCLRDVFSPLQIPKTHPGILIPSLALFCYNIVQAFVFPAIMTLTTLRFSWTGRENGVLLSIVHAVAALYLFAHLFAFPCVSKLIAAQWQWAIHGQSAAAAAIVSVCFEAFSLLYLSSATETRQVYVAVMFTAFGLATPAFLKSFVSTTLLKEDAPKVIAALAVFETTGGLLAPTMVGGLMANKPGPLSFLVSSGVLFTSAALISISVLTHLKRNVESARV